MPSDHGGLAGDWAQTTGTSTGSHKPVTASPCGVRLILFFIALRRKSEKRERESESENEKKKKENGHGSDSQSAIRSSVPAVTSKSKTISKLQAPAHKALSGPGLHWVGGSPHARSFVILPTYLTFLRYRVHSERTAGLDRTLRGRSLCNGFDPIWQTERKANRRDEGICRFGSLSSTCRTTERKRCR